MVASQDNKEDSEECEAKSDSIWCDLLWYQLRFHLQLYQSLHLGTAETASLPKKELIPVSDESIKKLVTETSFRRKFYKEAFEEMLEVRKIECAKNSIEETDHNSEEGNEHEYETPVKNSVEDQAVEIVKIAGKCPWDHMRLATLK